MPEDGSDNPIYPFNDIRASGDGDPYYPEYLPPSFLFAGHLKHPELTSMIRDRPLRKFREATAEEIP